VKKLVSIVGLTSSGKSGIGIELAKLFNGEVISCDSRQVYKTLDLSSGKVTTQEMDGIPHHLLDIAELGGELMDVFTFQKLAYSAIDDIHVRGKLPILVGGTGLYSRSIVEGYEFDKPNKPRYNVLQIALMPPKEVLAPLVKLRMEQRIEQGMVEEARKILDDGVSDQWLSSLGLECYWNVELIRGRITEDEYRKQLFTKTMQFAKRQRTWFKREKNTRFLTNREEFLKESIKLVKEFL